MKTWEFIYDKPLTEDDPEAILDILLENRGLKTKKEKSDFLNPIHPSTLKTDDLGINNSQLATALKRIKKAIKDKEEIVIYGDYDADGICATAILWECLYEFTKRVSPYIPDRFLEGYGIKAESVEKIKIENPDTSLIITVDNGIVGYEGIDKAKELGIDVIVTDHHAKGDKLPDSLATIHTDKISGSAVSWIFTREIFRTLSGKIEKADFALELAAIGTVADQLPLISENRSIVKHGLEILNRTKRPGLLALLSEAGVKLERSITSPLVGTYEINYVIAPRLNAMGRMENAIESLRLVCTKDSKRATELANLLGKTNKERQKVVEEVVTKAFKKLDGKSPEGAIVISGEYHEGVIGLAAGKLVEEFYRPAIVFSEGTEMSKASARSISGFNIIEAIRATGNLLVAGGGHPMAAGFTVKTENIQDFIKKFDDISKPLLTEEVLKKRLKVDLELDFSALTVELCKALEKFSPTGMGSPSPLFATRKVDVLGVKTVGTDGKHLKLYLENDGFKFNAIAFNFGKLSNDIKPDTPLDIAYNLEENLWNGNSTLQLKIKDIRF